MKITNYLPYTVYAVHIDNPPENLSDVELFLVDGVDLTNYEILGHLIKLFHEDVVTAQKIVLGNNANELYLNASIPAKGEVVTSQILRITDLRDLNRPEQVAMAEIAKNPKFKLLFEKVSY